MNNLFKFLSWPILCGILAGVIILEHFPGFLAGDQPVASTPNTPPAMQGVFSYSNAVERASPSVVNIYTSKTVAEPLPRFLEDPFFRFFLDRNSIKQKERIQRSLGSGVIMLDQGFILTNNHVISGADQILVLLSDGREALATVVGTDPETDLAVLKINLDGLQQIPIGKPSQAMVGDVVLAIGNPYGFGQSVSQGIISATGRYGLKLNTYENFIQTDAAINPGNSGGALIDARGNLLGINTAIYSRSGGSQGIGLAIPSDLALRIMSDLISYGRVIRGWLGIEVQAIPKVLADSNQLQQNNGVVVTGMFNGGPADKAGIQRGDIILRIGGQQVGDGQLGMNFIAATRPGDSVPIELMRNGEKIKIRAQVGSRPESS